MQRPSQKKPEETLGEEMRRALTWYADFVIRLGEEIRQRPKGQDFLNELTGRKKRSTLDYPRYK